MLDLTSVKPALQKLQAVETELSSVLIEREEAIRAAIIALLTRQHLALIGVKGAAKSHLFIELARRISPPSGTGLRYFGYLMTKFTTPDELFGPPSVKGLKNDEFKRITTGTLIEAEIGFLDEIYKANSAILNSLLTIMNERIFFNGTTQTKVPLISLFSASNELPQGQELEALWDRTLVRLMIGYVSESGFSKLMRMMAQNRAATSAPQTLLQTELIALQQTVEQIPVSDFVIGVLEQLRKDLGAKGIFLSDRRWGQSQDVLRAHALLEGRGVIDEDDLLILKHCLWESPEHMTEIGRIVARIGNPLNSKAVEIGDQATSIHQETMKAQLNGANDEQKMNAAVEGATKLKKGFGQLEKLREQAKAQGKSTSRIAKVIEQVQQMREEVARLVLN